VKTPEHIYQPACARCRDEAGKDRAGVTDTSLCNWHTNDLVLSLRAEVERLKKALAACTERLRHLHGLRMEGEPKALDFSHEFVLIRKARTANLSAPAEEEGRDA